MEAQGLPEIVTSFSSYEEPVNDSDTQDFENVVLKNFNNLIVLLDVKHPRVSSLLHISSDVYLTLFEKIFGYQPQDVVKEPRSIEDEAHNIQCIIDTLSLDILGVSLSHIIGEDILSRKSLPIHHLLDLISEFVKIRQWQPSPSSESVSLPVSSVSSTVCSSNVSHQEHFCPNCETSLPKSQTVCKDTVLRDVNQSLTSSSSDHSPIMHTGNTVSSAASVELTSSSCIALLKNVQSNSTKSISTSMTSSGLLLESSSSLERFSELSEGSSSLSLKSTSISAKSHRTSEKSEVMTARRRMKQEVSFNEKLAEKLAHNLRELKNTLAATSTTADEVTSRKPVISMDCLYKSVFQRNPQKKPLTPVKETSVLLPRYLKRRRSAVRIKVTPCKKQKCQGSAQDVKGSGILEEIKSNVPGVYFTQDRLNALGLDHKRQVKFLSSRLSALKKKVSASDKMLQDNILKQIQLSEIDLRDKQEAERLRNARSLRNEQLKVAGTLKNSNIQRARVKRYHDQYLIQHHRKLSSRKAREEMLLQGLYRHRLAIQKQQAIDLSKDLREQEQEKALELENRLASVQNFYLGKLDIQKKLAKEQQAEKEAQVKAQHQVLEQTRRTILKQIENEVKEIQENLEKQDDFHFVEADAERLREHWSKPR